MTLRWRNVTKKESQAFFPNSGIKIGKLAGLKYLDTLECLPFHYKIHLID